jgi:hypothetical protein
MIRFPRKKKASRQEENPYTTEKHEITYSLKTSEGNLKRKKKVHRNPRHQSFNAPPKWRMKTNVNRENTTLNTTP